MTAGEKSSLKNTVAPQLWIVLIFWAIDIYIAEVEF